jgi:putative ABC transport system permease protein
MEYISLSYASLGIAVLFIVSAMVVSCRYSLGLERDLAVGAVRAFVQLTAIGYVLQLLFVSARWYYVVIMLIIMLAAAIKNAVARQSAKLKGMFTTLGISIFVGSALTTAVVIGIILRVRPWYSPRYLIPLASSKSRRPWSTPAPEVHRYCLM